MVYAPYAVLHHYESKSRGLEDTPEKVARFNREIATFAKRWPEILKERRSVLQSEPDAAEIKFCAARPEKGEDRGTI